MKIEYVWHDEPDRVKIFDTEKIWKRDRLMLSHFDTIEAYNECELRNFERDKERGLVLSYRVVDEKQEAVTDV